MNKVLRYNLEGKVTISNLLGKIPVNKVPYWECAVTVRVLEYLKQNLHDNAFTYVKGGGIYHNSKGVYSVHFYVTDKMKNQKQLLLRPFEGLVVYGSVEINIELPDTLKEDVIIDTGKFEPTERPKQFVDVTWGDRPSLGRVELSKEEEGGNILYNPLPSFKKIIGKLYWKKWEG